MTIHQYSNYITQNYGFKVNMGTDELEVYVSIFKPEILAKIMTELKTANLTFYLQGGTNDGLVSITIWDFEPMPAKSKIQQSGSQATTFKIQGSVSECVEFMKKYTEDDTFSIKHLKVALIFLGFLMEAQIDDSAILPRFITDLGKNMITLKYTKDRRGVSEAYLTEECMDKVQRVFSNQDLSGVFLKS